ncbi:MAG: tRNA pseudouridine(38-40) synthase TruA [Bacteroidales bacterium]|nr:tRNA pseudouridine(38-40) synthase TruA [Bacteroidales bacterium]
MADEQKYRYFAEISFKGTRYHGWQIQKNAISVQEVLNERFSSILREEIQVTGAGRTDTGVHALYYVGHFDSIRENLHADTSFLYHINQFLPSDISVYRILPVKNDAHARFSAISRTYEYRICRRKNPFLQEYAWMFYRELNVKAMQNACGYLVGKHDFSSFCKVHSGARTHLCAVEEAEWTEKEDMLIFRITADRFLRNMVRAIVGTMIEIGKEALPPDELHDILEAHNRSQAGESVPPQGLFLTRIIYPPEIFIGDWSPLSLQAFI